MGVFVIYCQGEANTNTIEQAMEDGTWAEVKGQPEAVAEKIVDIDADADYRNSPWPGMEKPEVREFLDKNKQAFIKGDDEAGHYSSEGWLDRPEKVSDRSVNYLSVPIGFSNIGLYPEKMAPVITALVGKSDMMTM